MKKVKSLTYLLVGLATLGAFPASAQKMHRLSFTNSAALQEFFHYKAGKKIISGHRGTLEQGLPENSIAAMEAVLRHTPAIFEIDPRLTKDSVAVVLHDKTLDRTTTGTGNVSDYTWEELQKLHLRDKDGKVTAYRISTLEEMILWAKGKTILNLDKKDLPLAFTAEIIRKHQAYSWVVVTVHTAEQAKFYLASDAKQYLSMHLKNEEALQQFQAAHLPYNRMFVYIGAELKASNQSLYRQLNAQGVMCMISTASSYDKIKDTQERYSQYRAVFADGANILESDYPIEVYQAIHD